jgi:hypothetical protein
VSQFLTTAQPPGAYLTTAAQSDHSHGFVTTTTNGAVAVVAGSNSNGVTLANPAWITTYATQTVDANKAGTGFTSASTAGVVPAATLNTAGLSMGIPAWITTYAAQTNQTAASGNIAGVGTTFAGTNVSGSMTLNSAGLQLNLSAGAGGGGADGYNSAQFTNSTANSTMPLLWAGNSNGSGNVTIGLTGSIITMSAPAGGGAGDGVNVLQMGTTGTTGTTFSASTGTVFFNGSNNVTVSQNGSNQIVIVGPNVSQYLTTAMVSNAGSNFVGLNSALTANGVSATINSSGVSLNFPAFLTTAAATNVTSGRAGTGFTSASTAGVVPVGTLNTNGLSMGIPAWITTYAAQTNQTAASGNIAGVGTTFAGTNATATMGLNSAGLALSLSVAAGGAINQTGPNIAVAGSTVTSGDVYFSNSPTVTFGMAGSTITASAAGGGGGGGATVSGYELFPPLGGNTAFSTGVNGTIYFQKFIAPANIAFSNFERRYSGSTVSSAISAQAAHSISYGLYSRGSGASTSIYNLIASSNFFMQASYSSNLSAGHTVSAGATSFTTSSAGTVAQGNLTGYKHMYFPFVSTLTAGVEYAYAQIVSSATTGATGPLRIAFQELSVINNLTIGKIYNSTVAASAASFVGDWAQGVYSSSSNGLPATLAISGLTNAVSQQRMYLQLDA